MYTIIPLCWEVSFLRKMEGWLNCGSMDLKMLTVMMPCMLLGSRQGPENVDSNDALHAAGQSPRTWELAKVCQCLGTCDTLLCVSHTLQSALESGQEARIMQIDFSAAFDRGNHQGIIYRLSSVGIGCSVVVVVVVVIGQTVGSISSRTLAYDCLCTLELCTASMIATS